MSKKKRKLPRRDYLHAVGVRAALVPPDRAAAAWYQLAGYLQGLGDRDMPKFRDVVQGIRSATINAKGKPST